MHALGQTEGSDPAHLYRELTGTQHLNDVVLVDQSPIGRTPRSNPVTYIKAFDAIRELFAAQPDAKRRGFTAGHFSFNVPGGRCDVCEGDGTVTVEMQFLADVELPCEECNGTRYKSTDPRHQVQGQEHLRRPQHDRQRGPRFFAGHPKILDKLYVLDEVGLGYVRLGQSATTLSGGEAQRVKLASHLATARSPTPSRTKPPRKPASAPSTSSTNPPPASTSTTSPCSSSLPQLVDGGHSLLVIEHNLDVIKSADWVIDLGPDGGVRGGQIVAQGTPEEIAANPASHTGHWLAPVAQLCRAETRSRTSGHRVIPGVM